MRYPRAYFVFDKQEKLPSEEYFKSLGNSSRSPYILGVSRPIKSLEKETDLILEVDSCLNNGRNRPRDLLTLSHPKIFDFLLAYFGDKNLSIYWIDDKNHFEKVFIAQSSINDLSDMNSLLYEASQAYSYAYRGFYHLVKRDIYPYDDFISTIQGISCREPKTILESELRVLLNQLLSVNVLNRFDL